MDPSSTELSPVSVTDGATLVTPTTCTASETASEAPSESVTLSFTSVVTEPSGKLHAKLPPSGVVASEPAT